MIDFLEYAVLTVCTRVDALLGYLADVQVDRNMTGYWYKHCGVLATKQYFFGSHIRHWSNNVRRVGAALRPLYLDCFVCFTCGFHAQGCLRLIYVRTCRVRNGYRMGQADILCNYFLIDTFMFQRDGPAPGACAQKGPLRNRRWRSFSSARHVDAPSRQT